MSSDEQLGLRPRPSPDPGLVALLAAAVLEVWPRGDGDASSDSAERERVERAERAWRFSGRWWSRPLPVRRDRPWVR